MFQKRLYEIDLLRFIAAVMVVFFHYTIDTHYEHGTFLINNNFVNSIFLKGNLGVRLFFLISGFVILMSAQFVSPAKFIKSRIIRLYPAFIPICIITYIVGKLFVATYNVSITDFFINLSLIGIIGSMAKVQLVAGVYWTLIVEIQFYLFIYILLVLNKMKYIRTFLVAWLTLSVLTYYGELYFNYHTIFNKIRMIFITEHAFFFIGGCYFYLIKYQRKKFDMIMPLITLIFSLACFINHSNYTLSYASAGIIISFYMIFYWISLQNITFKKHQNLYKALGNLTYPLYLIHEIFGVIVIGALLPYINKPLLLILMIFTVVGITYVFNKYVEVKLMSRLKKVLDKK